MKVEPIGFSENLNIRYEKERERERKSRMAPNHEKWFPLPEMEKLQVRHFQGDNQKFSLDTPSL